MNKIRLQNDYLETCFKLYVRVRNLNVTIYEIEVTVYRPVYKGTIQQRTQLFRKSLDAYAVIKCWLLTALNKCHEILGLCDVEIRVVPFLITI